jgi:hypothetical protein
MVCPVVAGKLRLSFLNGREVDIRVSKSLPIVLTASAVAGGNEWLQSGQLPWRIAIAGTALGLVFAGLETISEKGAVALSVTMLITALVTPFHGNSPVQEFSIFIGTGPKPAPPTRQKAGKHG